MYKDLIVLYPSCVIIYYIIPESLNSVFTFYFVNLSEDFNGRQRGDMVP